MPSLYVCAYLSISFIIINTLFNVRQVAYTQHWVCVYPTKPMQSFANKRRMQTALTKLSSFFIYLFWGQKFPQSWLYVRVKSFTQMSQSITYWFTYVNSNWQITYVLKVPIACNGVDTDATLSRYVDFVCQLTVPHFSM